MSRIIVTIRIYATGSFGPHNACGITDVAVQLLKYKIYVKSSSSIGTLINKLCIKYVGIYKWEIVT